MWQLDVMGRESKESRKKEAWDSMTHFLSFIYHLAQRELLELRSVS